MECGICRLPFKKENFNGDPILNKIFRNNIINVNRNRRGLHLVNIINNGNSSENINRNGSNVHIIINDNYYLNNNRNIQNILYTYNRERRNNNTINKNVIGNNNRNRSSENNNSINNYIERDIQYNQYAHRNTGSWSKCIICYRNIIYIGLGSIIAGSSENNSFLILF